MTINVVEDGLNDVWQHAELIRHHSRNGAAKVVKTPLWQWLCSLVGPFAHSK